MRNILRALAIASAGLFTQDIAHATTATFTDSFSFQYVNSFGIPIGTATWSTSVSLTVPVTVMPVGAINSFTILGNVTNSATGTINVLANVATVFGTPSFATDNIETAQPFNSFITIGGSKIFVGPANDWKIRAFDQVSSGTVDFSGTIAGVGAKYTNQVQGPSTADWFEPIGESNVKVRIENRVLSSSNHGKFTGTGPSFQIDGFFQDLGVGTSTLAFQSLWNDAIYGLLIPSSNIIVHSAPINLSVEITSIEEQRQFPWPSSLTVMTISMLGLFGYSRWRRNTGRT